MIKRRSISEAVLDLKSEVNCRRAHGADGAEHLLYIEKRLDEIYNRLVLWKAMMQKTLNDKPPKEKPKCEKQLQKF